MSRPLRYSERKRLAETGSLGDLSHDTASEELRWALHQFLNRNWFSKADFLQEAREHFGWRTDTSAVTAVMQASPEEIADICELYYEASRRYSGYHEMVEAGLNKIFDRHRFGFKMEQGQMTVVGSPALTDILIGPALLATQRPGWKEVERTYREALDHQRGGPDENDDALTAANSALEAALKAAGMKGNDLSALAKSLRGAGLVPPQLEGVPDMLDGLLKRSGALRNTMSDSHGKAPGAPEVPQELVDLAIHWTGAFIVYLSRAAPQSS